MDISVVHKDALNRSKKGLPTRGDSKVWTLQVRITPLADADAVCLCWYSLPILYHHLPHLSFWAMLMSPPVTLLKNSASGLYNMTWKCSRACTLFRDLQFLNQTRLSRDTPPTPQKVFCTNASIMALDSGVSSPVTRSSSSSNLVQTTRWTISRSMPYGQSLYRTL